MKQSLKLHGYWRSTASYRVRIALNLKGLSYEQATYDLRRGEQRGADFLSLSPQGLVPVLAASDLTIGQSGAIIEWLEECYPHPSLLPADANGRAIVRSMALTICCDIHPLNNLRVLSALKSDFVATQAQIDAWIARWIGEGFAAIEQLIGVYGGRFAFGDEPGMADCCLVPQVYSANRFGVDLTPFPRVVAAVANAGALPAFAAAEPSRQPDADRQ